MMYGIGFADPGPAGRILRLAKSIKLPERRSWRVRSSPAALPKRVLVRGRGLARRRRSHLAAILAALLGLAVWLLLLPVILG